MSFLTPIPSLDVLEIASQHEEPLLNVCRGTYMHADIDPFEFLIMLPRESAFCS